MNAAARRALLAAAAAVWMSTEPGTDEADTAMEEVLIALGVVGVDDAILEITAGDDDHTVTVLLEDGTAIEIDANTGSTTRGDSF